MALCGAHDDLLKIRLSSRKCLCRLKADGTASPSFTRNECSIAFVTRPRQLVGLDHHHRIGEDVNGAQPALGQRKGFKILEPQSKIVSRRNVWYVVVTRKPSFPVADGNVTYY
ncbi:hypothetical protein EVAR_102375_1 [Eumeta japonica]|uniref:Uncharacterized protein n=1 Tax=Eumeta variegata TaxID=151549 RepID=A0A4C2A716_EUMVA|nr:hypothetical protein EVAR_102375_1 [Eumeta japonica]